MAYHRLILIALAIVLASGCGSTIYKPFSIDKQPATSLSIDAKQRLLLVTDKVTDQTSPEDKPRKRRVVCAEPSPDALVGLAASADLNANVVSQGGGAASAKFAEAVGEIGQRTVTVQLLRDGLYRACEAYMNGAIGSEEYKNLLRGYAPVMLTLLTVASLTQTAATNQLILNPKAPSPKSPSKQADAGQAVPGSEPRGQEVNAPERTVGGAPTMDLGVSDTVAHTIEAVVKDYLQKYFAYLKMVHAEQTAASSSKQ